MNQIYDKLQDTILRIDLMDTAMSNNYDWNEISRQVIDFVCRQRLERNKFVKAAGISVEQYDDLMTGRAVSEEVLNCVSRLFKDRGEDAPNWTDVRSNAPPRFEVPEDTPPEPLKSGAFLMYRQSFDFADRIISAIVVIYEDAKLGRWRFVSAQRNSGPAGRTYEYVHEGYVWQAATAGLTQLIALDDDCLRVITLARPLDWVDNATKEARVSIRGSLQAISQKGDKSLYPAFSPVIFENIRIEPNTEDGSVDWPKVAQALQNKTLELPDEVGSFHCAENEMSNISARLKSAAENILPACFRTQKAAPIPDEPPSLSSLSDEFEADPPTKPH
ncbi:hypothetical protein [Ruegeria sp. ANG-S4]|uniref:hypothetical protein n=1 Tax=Ruegeria sp. ANG-S4 TaxID=1577904 RepID=UPI00126A330D|nr:hypothetical protein [Ruegeria sp. ANG-S4]